MTFFDNLLLLISYFSEMKCVMPEFGGSYVISVYKTTHCGHFSLLLGRNPFVDFSNCHV